MKYLDQERDVVDRGIALWDAEKPELDCSGKAITGRILSLSEIVEQAMNASLRDLGIRYSSYAIIATLRAVGAPYKMSPGQLQNTLVFSSGGISNLIRRVEKEGYITRETDPSDGRGVLVALTPSGIDLADRAMPLQAAAELHLIRMLTPEEQAVMTNLLRRMLVMNRNGLR